MIGLLLSCSVIKFDPAKANVVFHGNSIVYGDAVTTRATDSWPVRLAAAAPINGALTIPNLGRDGATITQLDAYGSEVDSLYAAGKTNVLLFYEGTNTISSDPSTVASAFTALQTYINNRLALHPWKIVLVSTIPAYSSGPDSTTIAVNNNIDAFNAGMKANFKAWGAVMYADVRNGAPWGILPNYNNSSFSSTAMNALFAYDRVHPNTAGTQLLADLLAPQLRRIPLR